MIMVPSPHDHQDTEQHHHLYSATTAGYGGEIESIHRRFLGFHNYHQSTSSSDTVFGIYNNLLPADEMADDSTDPNQPSSNFNLADDDSWLCLRLGGDNDQSSTPDRRGPLVELDLLPAGTNSPQEARSSRPPVFFHAPDQFRAPPRPVTWPQGPAPEINWALMRPNNYFVANPSICNLVPITGPNFFARPYGRQMGLIDSRCDNGGGTSSSSGGVGGAMRIIRPPRRPHAGVWFMLQASPNQVKEPFLPQVPKSYLRIKDGRMTVRLLMKYLVLKLRLDSESEVEIRCREQELQPMLTLQHVRDEIWCSRREAPLTLLTNSTMSSSAVAADSHIMILHYARPISTTTAAATSSI